MRKHGILTKWNDDRGFGFITPAGTNGEIFVHISAFPRGGTRPRLNELVSFEIETGQDGKTRAIRVMRPGQASKASYIAASSRRPATSMLGGLVSLAALAALGAYGYSWYSQRSTPVESTATPASEEFESESTRFSCDGRTHCSEMTSCAEATYFIEHCPGTTMDGNGDGIPCESQWCN
jgi:cold shock CspA family protein